MIEEDRDRSAMRAAVDGQIGGNPPYNDAKRKAAGLGWTANINLMGGKALMDSSSVPYYAIFKGVEYYAETCTSYKPTDPEHDTWNQKIARRFHNMLERWKGFDWNIQHASYHMRKHGIGACFFERMGDWRFRSIASGCLLTPRSTPSCVDKRLKHPGIRVRYTVSELWDFIRDEEAATKKGWNVPAVKLAIKNAAQHLLGDQAFNWYTESWETFQRALKSNDLQTSYVSDDIPCGHLLVQEFSGKVSHVIVTESELIPTNNNAEPPKDIQFLYRHVDCYKDFNEALVVFFQDIGEGTWHTVRGLGDISHKHIELINRLMCRTFDGAFIEGSLVIKPGTTRNGDKLQLVQMGPVTMLPAGAEIQQTKVAGFIEAPLAVVRAVRNDLSSNVGMFQQRNISRDDGRGETVTAKEVEATVAKESTLTQGQMTLFYEYLDSLYEQVYVRAADPNTTDEEAKRFQDECEQDGVPKEALQKMEYVRANRSSGYGSPQMRQLTDEQMLKSGAVSAMPPEGQQNFWRHFTGGIKGADKVDLFFPREHIPKQDDADAAMENAMVAMGRMPVITSSQDDIIHMHSHLDDAANVLTPVKDAMEGGQNDPEQLQQAYAYLQIMGPHCQAHLGPMKANPVRKGQAKYFEDQLKNLVSFSGKLRRAIITAQNEARLAAEQEQQAVSLSALDQARVESERTKAAMDVEKTQSAIRNKSVKTVSDIRLKQLQTAEEIRRNRAVENQPETDAA